MSRTAKWREPWFMELARKHWPADVRAVEACLELNPVRYIGASNRLRARHQGAVAMRGLNGLLHEV